MSGVDQKPLRNFYEPRHPNFAVWQNPTDQWLQGQLPHQVATPPHPLTARHNLLPLYAQRAGGYLFVLAFAPELGRRGRVTETAAIVARDFAAQNLICDGKIFHRNRLDY